MTLTIPDDILKAAKLDAPTLLVDFACYLFDKQRLGLHEAATFAGMNRTEFEDELRDRHIPVYRLTLEDFQLDLQTLHNKPVEN